MAFWGDASAEAQGPVLACQSALRCLRDEEELRNRDPQTYPAATQNHIAIHAGRAIVGNIGCMDRLSHTAIGENVELSWGLKQLNASYGSRIIISEPVRAAVKNRFWLRQLDAVSLDDATERLPIYELLGDRSEPLSEDQRIGVLSEDVAWMANSFRRVNYTIGGMGRDVEQMARPVP